MAGPPLAAFGGLLLVVGVGEALRRREERLGPEAALLSSRRSSLSWAKAP